MMHNKQPYSFEKTDVRGRFLLNFSCTKVQSKDVCPMPFDEVERLINFYSMPGETVADPFGGLGTTGVVSLKMGRKVILTELNDVYAKTAAMYLKETEIKNNLPTLFDFLQPV